MFDTTKKNQTDPEEARFIVVSGFFYCLSMVLVYIGLTNNTFGVTMDKAQRIIAAIILLVSMLFVCFQASVVFADSNITALEKCEPYRDFVQEILDSEGVSTDYYYLMVAESRCTEKAESSKGAQGFWQLMPSTSRHYGCNDPHNLECASRAAAKYIKHLESSFESFNDVIAAYNMGGHNYAKYGATKQAMGLISVVNTLINLSEFQAAPTEESVTNDNQ